MAKTKKIKCPACGEFFELEDGIKAGDAVCCVDCDHELQIVRLDPPKVKKVVNYPEVYSEDHHKQRSCTGCGSDEDVEHDECDAGYDEDDAEEDGEESVAADDDIDDAAVEEEEYKEDS
jgi:lysine biosynthesis protein LysW